MKTIYFRVGHNQSVVIGNQFDHKANRIVFTNCNYSGDVYINIRYQTPEGNEQLEKYKLNKSEYGLEFEIGYPLTSSYGEFHAQLVSERFGIEGEKEYQELSKVFTLVINQSIEQGNKAESPIDPVLPLEKIETIINGAIENIKVDASDLFKKKQFGLLSTGVSDNVKSGSVTFSVPDGYSYFTLGTVICSSGFTVTVTNVVTKTNTINFELYKYDADKKTVNVLFDVIYIKK